MPIAVESIKSAMDSMMLTFVLLGMLVERMDELQKYLWHFEIVGHHSRNHCRPAVLIDGNYDPSMCLVSSGNLFDGQQRNRSDVLGKIEFVAFKGTQKKGNRFSYLRNLRLHLTNSYHPKSCMFVRKCEPVRASR